VSALAERWPGGAADEVSRHLEHPIFFTIRNEADGVGK
jgi:hypothetical protein